MPLLEQIVIVCPEIVYLGLGSVVFTVCSDMRGWDQKLDRELVVRQESKVHLYNGKRENDDSLYVFQVRPVVPARTRAKSNKCNAE